MTIEEVRNIIIESKKKSWFENILIGFSYTGLNLNLKLKGVSAIYEYCVNQLNGWESLGDNIPQEFLDSKNIIKTLKADIAHFITENNEEESENYLDSEWKNNVSSKYIEDYIPYQLSEVNFLIKLYETYPNYFTAAYSFIFSEDDTRRQWTNKNDIMGTLMAYEFMTKDSSEILSRKNAEAQSVINTKKDFENYLSSSEQRINDLLKEINAKKNTDAENITILLENKTKEFDTWHNDSQNAYKNFIKESADQIDILEESYSEKLKLEAPSHYWQVRSEKLKKEGKTYMTWMISMIVLGVVLLFVLLVCTPKDLLESFFGDNKLSAVRWSIVFVVFISLIVAGIRMLSKLMFSSFHLSRDAEERQQLTHVYLALIKDAKIDKEERQLIMQSLFSRADTGLLKEDSAPTMPSGIEKIFKG